MKPRSLVSQSPTSPKLTTGCETLDSCLRGGFPCGSLTEIAAESGCGKTQLCLQLSLRAQLPVSIGGLDGSSLYLHSEFPFPFRRLHQLSRSFTYRTLASTRITAITLAITSSCKASTP
ncbi:DNA repair protein XRCC3-like protein [Raphanus sativus]|nr:DNA repair protein XRCC3-like protein [Raphanus sativus]